MAIKTKQNIDQGRSGSMMVDVAYRLAPPDSQRDFGREALEAIMDTIEGSDSTETDRLAYIFAGYPKEMNLFLKLNPGLLRRVTNFLQFYDYSMPELAAICKLIAKKNDMLIKVRTSSLVNLIHTFPACLCSCLNAGLSQQEYLQAKGILCKKIVDVTQKDPSKISKDFVTTIDETVINEAVSRVRTKYSHTK